MSVTEITQQPLTLGSGCKRDVRTQFGALCWRMHKGKLKVALVTSRRSHRWILPKGWPVDGATPAQAAAREAYEEAGLEGK
ncbi:MAG: NUDIX domain-containing protein, partial [Pseudomonadota bacterium]